MADCAFVMVILGPTCLDRVTRPVLERTWTLRIGAVYEEFDIVCQGGPTPDAISQHLAHCGAVAA